MNEPSVRLAVVLSDNDFVCDATTVAPTQTLPRDERKPGAASRKIAICHGYHLLALLAHFLKFEKLGHAILEEIDGYDRRLRRLRGLQPEFLLQSLSEPQHCAENFSKSTAGEFPSVYP